MTNFKSLVEFTSYFKDEKACIEYFEQIRFKDGEYCPHCGHPKIYRMKNFRYRCAECRKDFTIKIGTIFGESKIPLQKWFMAIYLLSTSKKGISSIELAEKVGVTQKTAWFMDHRIRKAMKQGNGKLFGVVEVDETYIGGKFQGKGKGLRRDNKGIVMGMVERGGQIRAYKVRDTKGRTLLKKINDNVEKGSKIMSDELWAYHRTWGMGYSHYSVNHSAKEYVRGSAHTNTIEGFWSQLKRGYHGTYHSMSKKHLQKYVDEFVYRFNARKSEIEDKFEDIVRSVSQNDKLSYKALIK